MPTQRTLQNHPPRIIHEYQACYNASHIIHTCHIFSTLQKTYVTCIIIPYFTVEETKVQLTCYHQFQALTGSKKLYHTFYLCCLMRVLEQPYVLDINIPVYS